MTEFEQLRKEVDDLRQIVDALLRLHWDERGLAKSLCGRIEKELEKPFKDYLERNKNGNT